MHPVYKVTWTDSNMIHEQTDVVPEVATIETSGFLISDDDKETIIARDIINDEYRSIIAIPKKCVISILEME